MLNQLENDVIDKAINIHDYIQLYFSSGYILSIYNAYEYSEAGLGVMVGRVVNSIKCETEDVVLEFDDGSQLKVLLNDCAYNGPEVMTLFKEGCPLTVWRADD